jgi:hypothetical protein
MHHPDLPMSNWNSLFLKFICTMLPTIVMRASNSPTWISTCQLATCNVNAGYVTFVRQQFADDRPYKLAKEAKTMQVHIFMEGFKQNPNSNKCLPSTSTKMERSCQGPALPVIVFRPCSLRHTSEMVHCHRARHGIRSG